VWARIPSMTDGHRTCAADKTWYKRASCTYSGSCTLYALAV